MASVRYHTRDTHCNAEDYHFPPLSFASGCVGATLDDWLASGRGASTAGERNRSANCAARALSQGKFATNAFRGGIPKACFLTLGAR